MINHGLPVPIDSVDITGDFTAALLQNLPQPASRGENRACILHQYIRQRKDCATEAKPSIVPRNLLPPASASSLTAAKDEEEYNRAKLRIKTDSRRIYVPGQSVEAIIALDRQWFEARQDAQDGFSHVELSFGGV